MNSGITRQALRRHRRTLAGPAVTQLIAATVIATMIDTRESLTRSLTRSLTLAPEAGAKIRNVQEFCAVFLGDAVYLSIVIVGATMSLALGGQLRDVALLRSVGAAPSQVRRSVALQAVTTAVPTALLGVVLAVPTTAGWLALLRAHAVVPAQATFAWSPTSIPVAVAAVTGTSLLASLLASRRTARMKPAAAMVEVAGGRRPRVVVLRTLAGLLLVVGGVVLSVLLAARAPAQLADAAVFVLLAECLGAGLLAPALLRTGSRVAGALVPNGVVRVAADDLRAHAHRLGGALVPLVLGGAFTIVKIGVHTTAVEAGGADSVVERWLDWSGSAMFCAFAAVAAVNCLLTVTVSRRRDLAAMALAGADRATVLRVVGVQAAVVTVVAVVSAGAIAIVTLAPILHATLGVWWPHLPVPVVVTAVVTTGALVLAGTVLPAARLTRRSPVRVTAAAA